MEVVRKISKVVVDVNDRPKLPIIIVDSGEIGDKRLFLKVKTLK